jgi:hypothetical protein
MDFTSLINKNSEIIAVQVPGEGYRDWDDGGTWKEGTPQEIERQAAVFQMGVKGLSTKIQYGEGGKYDISDIKVYIQEKLPIGTKLKWRGSNYTVSEELDYSGHSKDLYIYICKKGVSNNGL